VTECGSEGTVQPSMMKKGPFKCVVECGGT
jgi:hypothetical protein